MARWVMVSVRGVTVGDSLGIDRYMRVILGCCDRLRRLSLGYGKVGAEKVGRVDYTVAGDRDRKHSTIERTRREKRKFKG